MTGPLASTTGERFPLRSIWGDDEVRAVPALLEALITLEASERGGYVAKITPDQAQAVREYILKLRERGAT